MGKVLVLAEKPSVGRDLAKVLKCNQKGNGYIEGNKYIVTWALGHLVTLANPEAYGEKYKTWSLENLPMLPNKMELSVIKKTGKQFNAVKNLMKRKDISELVIATDAGREGELVARWIIEKVGFKKPIKRLWISSQTDKAIKDGFNNLKQGKNYENLYKSAVCRAQADWIVGLNVTRALTCKYNAQLSAGRVQTPTLAMIVQREEEIKNFIPKNYYTITGNADNFILQWIDNKGGQTRTFNKDKAQKIVSKVNGQYGEIIEVNKTSKKKYSPFLYDLTELQRDANKKFGYSAKKTLSIMQRLYENHKILTYPRTDSRYLTTDIVETIPERLKSISVGPYTKAAQNLLRGKIKVNKSFVDNSKVSEHHAIIPTEQIVILGELSIEERNIYDLVVKRFLSVMYPPFEYEQTKIKALVNGETFIAKGKIVKSKGWKAVYSNEYNEDETDEEIKDQSLPQINKGDEIKLTGVKIVKGQTKPPARYNEATLLSAMENPQKFMNIGNKELIKTIDEVGGLGTVATRADIIEKLFNVFYIEKKGKEIFPTSKGKQLIELVPLDLKSPTLTAKWEQQLIKISKGDLNYKEFIQNMKEYASKLVLDVANSSYTYRHDNMTRERCPECNKYLLEVNSKKGKILVCQDRECGYRKGVSKLTNARCPQCHRRLELRGQGEGQIFKCPKCSYKEKLSAFNKRKKEQGAKVNKRDVVKYMKKQKKENEQQLNSALADALSKWKQS
ncbi:DNA topoisomerase III [Tepidibacter formicigenes]|jgi:DNA topoisomerase-3|uniref:DNA topoisomerase 3 n=1 Tax=Tepidibacter formicigenes DSM 15518 TaxID=1123349 RepID=A0A1M6L4Y8_9FIRM|nr:DNA topoisomerase III [Tepidibacter formicigenes]SHJ66270.1 DNA topoisomerase-3 [Tepidibacter formicigenes DSM 15518]